MAKIKLDIELADNGVILRDPENSDIVTLAKTEDYGHSEDKNDVYKAVGKRVMDALERLEVPQGKKLYGYKLETTVQLVAKNMGEF